MARALLDHADMRALTVIGLLGLGFAACTLDTTPDSDGGDDLTDADDTIGDDAPDDGDVSDDGPFPCSADDGGGEAQEASLRNPENLECEDFSGECDPRCGACDQAPTPSWGVCGSECENLTEFACSENEACRVVKDAACLIKLDCLTDYVGCFPTDMSVDAEVDCWRADAFECSRSPDCSAAHSASGEGEGRPFELCIVEGKTPGYCHVPVACDQAAPDCPQGTTPGVENACYTGACIPEEFCQDF